MTTTEVQDRDHAAADVTFFDSARRHKLTLGLLERDSSGAPIKDGDGRLVVTINAAEEARTADAAWVALMHVNDPAQPTVMVRGSELVRLSSEGTLDAFNAHSLKDEISRNVAFVKATQSGQGAAVSPAPVPAFVPSILLNRDATDYWRAPRVDTVTDVPVVGRTGALITGPGCHADDRIYYRPAAALAGVEPADVELIDDVTQARDLLLDELLGDFDFEDKSSRANALGLLLLPFLRPFIGVHPTPLHLIMAHVPGAGKGTLAHACLIPGVGEPAEQPEGKDEEELRKRITSILIKGTRAVVFDNVARQIASGNLAAALTSRTWEDRVLGESRIARCENQTIWVATGNNVDLTDEIARRCVPIWLNPLGEPAARRDKAAFRHEDLIGWTHENRARLVQAALTLIAHWLRGPAQPMPDGTFARDEDARLTGTQRSLGSFERWSQVVGGVLIAADVDGFLANRDRLADEINVEAQELAAFLAAWRATTTEPVKTSELAAMCTGLNGSGNGLRDALPTELLGHGDELEKKLRYWLRRHSGQVAGGLRLHSRDVHGGVKAWWPEPIDGDDDGR